MHLFALNMLQLVQLLFTTRSKYVRGLGGGVGGGGVRSGNTYFISIVLDRPFIHKRIHWSSTKILQGDLIIWRGSYSVSCVFIKFNRATKFSCYCNRTKAQGGLWDLNWCLKVWIHLGTAFEKILDQNFFDLSWYFQGASALLRRRFLIYITSENPPLFSLI